MTFEWYVAELIMEVRVTDDPRNVVHENLVLIRADSGEEAYEKALQIGKKSETSYRNPAGDLVEIKFRGIADLDAIYEELEDGAELLFHYRVDVSPQEIDSLVRPRDRLRVFLPNKRVEGPDYASEEVINRIEHEFGIKRPDSISD